MPIKPENKALYPPRQEWQRIRARILARARQACERCGVLNHTMHPVTGARVVLTIAHYPDPNPANCDDSNLLALCQKCHNTLDATMRARHAKRTRSSKKAAVIEAHGQLALWRTEVDED